ncbi:hypothetical protein PW5551_09385 [Petrotoga sp. 9PW.55.5.1]|nr:hypothetical protein PW5551_09385 [Petrotoga sp. 9PW.55.5.1]
MKEMKEQIEIIKVMGMKPNFSELASIYAVDRRTVKKYYEVYEGKAKKRNKPGVSRFKFYLIEKYDCQI